MHLTLLIIGSSKTHEGRVTRHKKADKKNKENIRASNYKFTNKFSFLKKQKLKMTKSKNKRE